MLEIQDFFKETQEAFTVSGGDKMAKSGG